MQRPQAKPRAALYLGRFGFSQALFNPGSYLPEIFFPYFYRKPQDAAAPAKPLWFLPRSELFACYCFSAAEFFLPESDSSQYSRNLPECS
jgi:hypothetical protein